MTIYALDLGQVQQTIRDTLVDRVLPAVESDGARGELLGVIEMLDSLQTRLDWQAGPLSATVSRTRELGAALGLASTAEKPARADDVDALRSGRDAIGVALAAAYTDGFDPAVASAVAEFTAADIEAEISPALRPGLPD